MGQKMLSTSDLDKPQENERGTSTSESQLESGDIIWGLHVQNLDNQSTKMCQVEANMDGRTEKVSQGRCKTERN